MKENEEGIFRNGLFAVSPDRKISGTLSLNGPDSILHLWSDNAFTVDSSGRKTITGVLDDQKKVSLIECVTIHEGRYYGEEGVSQHYKFFPHYVIIGDRHFSHADKTISAISLIVDDAMTLFHDRESFGTLVKSPSELNNVIASEIFDGASFVGEVPVIAYYTGKEKIFSSNTVFGKVSARNSPSFNIGGPAGVYIKNTIFVDMEFNEPVSVREMDSRLRRVLRFFEVIVGRSQNLLEINIVQSGVAAQEASSVYINMYSNRSRIKVNSESDFRDILIDAVGEPKKFSDVLSAWLERDVTWRPARARFSTGWGQHRDYDADRIVRAANMFDLLPANDFPEDIPLSDELASAVAESKEKFHQLPLSDKRNAVLDALGRVGKQSHKQRIQHRSRVLNDVIGDLIPEVNIVTDAAVDCRNMYVHGDVSDRNRETLPRFLIFLTNTLEFIFCASDLVELGWDIGEWCRKPKLAGHPFCDYLYAYNANLAEFKRAWRDTDGNRS